MPCITCADDEPSETFKAGCGHDWCKECLERLFLLCLKDKSLFPPGCCPNQPFPNYQHTAQYLLTPHVYTEFEQKIAEYSTTNPLYCPRNTCSAFIQVSACMKRVRCKACENEVCTDCRQLWHQNRECAENEDERKLLELAHRNLWSVCPACKTICELVSGCNAVRCRCGQSFCFVCRRISWYHDLSCGCPPWATVKARTDDRRQTIWKQEEDRLAAEAERLEAIRKREEEDARILQEMRKLEELRGQQRREVIMLFQKRAVLEQTLQLLHLDAQRRTEIPGVRVLLSKPFEQIQALDVKQNRLARNAARIAQRNAKK